MKAAHVLLDDAMAKLKAANWYADEQRAQYKVAVGLAAESESVELREQLYQLEMAERQLRWEMHDMEEEARVKIKAEVRPPRAPMDELTTPAPAIPRPHALSQSI